MTGLDDAINDQANRLAPLLEEHFMDRLNAAHQAAAAAGVSIGGPPSRPDFHLQARAVIGGRIARNATNELIAELSHAP